MLIGAGGHGRVVTDIAEQTGKYGEVVFLDDNSNDDKVIGKYSDYMKFKSQDTDMYPTVGNNQGRVEWENKVEEAGIKLAKIIHPLAYVSPKADRADGCVVMPYAIVNTSTVVKKACIIIIGAIVDHDCILEEGCHFALGAIVKGENKVLACTKIESEEIVELQYYKK